MSLTSCLHSIQAHALQSDKPVLPVLMWDAPVVHTAKHQSWSKENEETKGMEKKGKEKQEQEKEEEG